MNKSVIIHKVSNGSGGIGDFVRASLSFYTFSKKNNIKYYIDFSGYKYLDKCFELKKIPENIFKMPSENIWLMNIVGNINNETLKKIITDQKVYYLISNAIGFENNDDIAKYIDKFFSKILKPSDEVQNYIKNTYEQLNITENNYVSFHTRCGDKIMCLNDNENLNKTHLLVNIDDENIYDKNIKFINDFVTKYNITCPIVIHSDSKIFKNKLKEKNNNLVIIDCKIRHNSENIGINTLQSNIETVGEFFIIAKSKCIISITYSGFIHMASLILKKKIYTSYAHHGYYKLINCQNIISI